MVTIWQIDENYGSLSSCLQTQWWRTYAVCGRSFWCCVTACWMTWELLCQRNCRHRRRHRPASRRLHLWDCRHCCSSAAALQTNSNPTHAAYDKNYYRNGERLQGSQNWCVSTLHRWFNTPFSERNERTSHKSNLPQQYNKYCFFAIMHGNKRSKPATQSGLTTSYLDVALTYKTEMEPDHQCNVRLQRLLSPMFIMLMMTGNGTATQCCCHTTSYCQSAASSETAKLLLSAPVTTTQHQRVKHYHKRPSVYL